MREEGKEAEWLMQRATNNDAPPDKRADAYTILASKKWECSYAITELPENKETSKDKPGDSRYKIKNPEKDAEAKKCVQEGLGLVEEALKLNDKNTSALAYKVNLMREQAKLAESDGKPDLKAQIDKEADVVEAEQKRLVEEKKSSEEAKKTPAAAG